VRGGHLGECHHFFTDKQLPAGFRSIAEQYADRIHTADDGRVVSVSEIVVTRY
jgi:DeoR family glycerol-3-phosphate regulon repressor